MILIIGLGSMGKRRIRCLQSLGYKNIVGFDPREDRRNEAKEKYGIEVSHDTVVQAHDTVFICSPPKTHKYYSDAVSGTNCFIEAGTEILDHGTPSATMLFNPLVKEIKQNLPEIGQLLNITYHCGQYLPDWHPYEKVSEFYAGEVGALEMVAFELMWLTHVLGFPEEYSGYPRAGKYIEGLDNIDSLVSVLSYNKRELAVSVVIDVVSRIPIRQLVINGTAKQLRYELNKGVSEQMYIDETQAFMDGAYPNTLEHSNKVIEITKKICV